MAVRLQRVGWPMNWKGRRRNLRKVCTVPALVYREFGKSQIFSSTSRFPDREWNLEPFNLKSRRVPAPKPSQAVIRQLFCMGYFTFSWQWLWRVTILWYVTPCSTVEVYWRFGGTCCFHLQGRRVSQAISQGCSFLDLRFPLRWVVTLWSSVMWRRVVW
jgi:hypothetical protein